MLYRAETKVSWDVGVYRTVTRDLKIEKPITCGDVRDVQGDLCKLSDCQVGAHQIARLPAINSEHTAAVAQLRYCSLKKIEKAF